MAADDLFTFPWPGPGNSEGPVDPEGLVGDVPQTSSGSDAGSRTSYLATSPWPGPGDSEG